MPGGSGSTYTLIMIVVLIAVFYLFMIRPKTSAKAAGRDAQQPAQG